jgi:very-short-patch-repair endonuclease
VCRSETKLSKPDHEPAFAALVGRQFGVFSRAQARACGISDTIIHRRVATGVWRVVVRGIYRVATAPETWNQRVMAACLLGGASAFASHACSAGLWRLDGFPCRPIEVSSQRRVKPLHRTRFHRVLPPPPGDVQSLGPFPVASVTRTLLEVAALVDDETLDIALDDALRRRLTSIPRLNWRLNQVGARGTSGAARLRTFIRQRDPRALPESALERKFLRLLAAHGFPRPTEIQRVVESDGFVARVDFAYPERRIVVEVDSYRHHSGRAQFENDRARRNRLEAMGWRVLHTTSEQIRNRPDDILIPLKKLLDPQLRLSPNLP